MFEIRKYDMNSPVMSKENLLLESQAKVKHNKEEIQIYLRDKKNKLRQESKEKEEEETQKLTRIRS